jgi:hypothetical protein
MCGVLAVSCSFGFDPTEFRAPVVEVGADGGAPGGSDGGATAAPTNRANPCASPNAAWVLCDDFESDVIDRRRWPSINEASGTVTIDTTRAVSGTRSLHAHNAATPDGATSAYLDRRFTVPPSFFVRMHVYMPSGPDFQHNERTFLLGQTDVDPFDGAQLGLMPNGLVYLVDWAPPGRFSATKESFPRNRWVCVEWTVAPGTMSVALDGTSLPDLEPSGWGTPPYGRIRVGQWLVGGNAKEGSPDIDLWIDDVIVSTVRVGCP